MGGRRAIRQAPPSTLKPYGRLALVRPRLGAALERRPILWSVALTVLWLVVVHLLGAVLVGGRDGAHLRAAAVNAGVLAVPLAVVGLAGWWSRAGLAGPVLGRHWFVLAPLGLVAVSWLAFGVKAEPASVVLAGAVLQLTLGLNEEAMFRGLVQGLWARQPAMTQCGAVALIFGLQHGANLLFGQSPSETAAQVLSATAFGFAYAGARLHVGSIWALALLHGLSNFCQDRLVGEAPWPMHLAVALLLGAYGLVLARAPFGPPGGRSDP